MKKLSILLSLIIGVLGKRCVGREVRKEVQINGIKGKLLKYLIVVMLFWGHTLITIKWDWGNFFPKIEKWLIPTVKDKKVISSNSLLKDTHMEELDSVQEFSEIQGWLLLTFFICLHNQLSSLNSVIVQMSEKHDSSSRQ